MELANITAVRVSIDKDLLWLEGTNFNWRKNEWYTVTKEQEEEYLSRSLICGDSVDHIQGLKNKSEAFCTKNNIKTLKDAFRAYLEHYNNDLLAVDEFYKNFKCLYILKESDKFTIPIPIKIEKNEYYNGEYQTSRSTARNLSNS